MSDLYFLYISCTAEQAFTLVVPISTLFALAYSKAIIALTKIS